MINYNMNDSFVYDNENNMFIHKYVTNNIFASYGDGTYKKLNYDAIHICTPFTYDKITYLIKIDSYKESREACFNLMHYLKK